jgi:peptidoglycan/xylan/chitin deacetylase (PgdA/CDA1 family)
MSALTRLLDRPSLASLLRQTGVLGVLERLRRTPGLLVLNYHRVGKPAGDPFDEATYSATAESLRAQLSYMKRWFAMPSPDEMQRSLTRRSFADPTVLLTFDDGYRDNHQVVFPMLHALRVPACFFVVTGLLDAPRLPWWDRVAYSVKRTRVERLTLAYPERLQFDLQTMSRSRVTWRILRACKDARPFDASRFFDALAIATGVDVDSGGLARTLFMSWDAVREMARAGMTIGSHTATHPVLASLSEGMQRRELCDSRERIAEVIGSKPDLLAYPVGGLDAFTETTKRLAREAGYRAAFGFWGGFNRASAIDPFAIARLGVAHAETWCQFRLRLTLATSRLGS